MVSSLATADNALTSLRARYVAAQLSGDRRQALRIVLDEGVARGASVLELHRHVIQEAQREIGRLWQENEISVAREHMATAVSQMVLAQLYDRAERARDNGKQVLVACVQGELHDMPARLVADALDLAGFQLCYLGADVNPEALSAAVSRERPDLIALSVTMDFNLSALRNSVALLRQIHGTAPAIMVGGAAYTTYLAAHPHETPESWGVNGTATGARELVRAAEQLLGVVS